MYGTRAEFKHRLGVFSDYLKFVQEHNSNDSNTWSVGVNEFSDWTAEERAKLLGYKANLKKANKVEELNTTNLADEVNWVTKGAVTPIKD
jgi:CDP-glycerol glycerophosphotransferase (TagB/SpsB family)